MSRSKTFRELRCRINSCVNYYLSGFVEVTRTRWAKVNLREPFRKVKSIFKVWFTTISSTRIASVAKSALNFGNEYSMRRKLRIDRQGENRLPDYNCGAHPSKRSGPNL